VPSSLPAAWAGANVREGGCPHSSPKAAYSNSDGGRGTGCEPRVAGEKETRGRFFSLFFRSFFYIISSFLRYKKSHRALAMAKTKPHIQNEHTKKTSVTSYLHNGPYRSLAHRRARRLGK